MASEAGVSAYICHDSDIVFFFADSKRSLLPKLKALVTQIMPNITQEDIDLDQAFEFYDLAVQFDAFKQKIRDKLHGRRELSDDEVVGAGFIADDTHSFSWDVPKFQDVMLEKSNRTKPLIAVIDDDEMIRMLAKSVLRPQYHVVCAAGALSGLELINYLVPDLVFLDVQMPGMDGIEALGSITKHAPGLPVIMFSAQSTSANIKRAIQLGAKSFVTKPFTASALLVRVEKALRGDFTG